MYSLIILKKKLGFTLRGVAQGVLKWPKMIFFGNFLAKTRKIVFKILHIIINNAQSVCPGTLPNIFEEKSRFYVEVGSSGCSKLT